MSDLTVQHFREFFGEIYKRPDEEPPTPFPWQERVAKMVCAGDWPGLIALPTAAGKTTCIDIAVFAMAYQQLNPPEGPRTAPRRIFFVVDRRIVVDQAFEHAKRLAGKLDTARSGIVKQVADALRQLAGDGNRPLDCYALRGGMYRESAWVRSPLQPTIITSTVDQVGSRLLFRGYGVSDSLKPLHAALVGNDSLILLDEAHCSKPFNQTMSAVKRYRDWTNELLPPFRFVSITATPTNDDKPMCDDEDDRNHPILGPRLKASKPAKLLVAGKAMGGKWREELVKKLAHEANVLMGQSLEKDASGTEHFIRAVGVIVNRVATARETAKALEKIKPDADVVLLTGRMRPMDRDLLVKRIEPLMSGNRIAIEKPIFVVATQCLEVGADLDFHGLVSECASLAALRQRFGRLNRVAARPAAKAVIVVRQDQTAPAESDSDRDPVYGDSLANTWQWLNQHPAQQQDIACFDFGVSALRLITEGMSAEELAKLNAPSQDAAVLLPAHLDCWVQTNPIPTPDPDPAVFLHGPTRNVPDVQVILRNDMGTDTANWAEIVSLCPPSSAEALPVRIDVIKKWFTSTLTLDDSSDVEGESVEALEMDDSKAVERSVLRWDGPSSDRTGVLTLPQNIRPGDTLILPANSPQISDLGDFPSLPPKDYGEESFLKSRDRAILRLNPAIRDISPELLKLDEDDDIDFALAISDEIEKILDRIPADDVKNPIRIAAKNLKNCKDREIKRYPDPHDGFVVIGKRRLGQFDPTFVEADESWESSTDQPIFLAQHCDKVASVAEEFARSFGRSDAGVFQLAGLLHDIGKTDPRFQSWLHGGDARKAALFLAPLAKSLKPMPSQADRRKARQRAGYPDGGRHELLSLRLAESNGVLPVDADTRDLILHLIASHHGYCRPFAPVIDDPKSVNVEYIHDGHILRASSATDLECIDSGVAERFWKLTHRYGWWGLPWLESILRLADWVASEVTVRPSDSKEH